MFIRFHRGATVDAVVPTASAAPQPDGSPADVLWTLSADINPSKTIQVTENVQATDPVTGAPLTNPDGTPQWATTTVTNPDGTTSEQIVTQQVSQTVLLTQDPSQFTQADIEAACQAAGVTFAPVGSLQDAIAEKVSQLKLAYASVLAAGFTSSADGTSRTYGFAQSDIDNLNEEQSTINANLETFPVDWADKAGNAVSLTASQWTTLATDAKTFKWAQVNHLRQQIGAAKTCTTNAAVEAVSW